MYNECFFISRSESPVGSTAKQNTVWCLVSNDFNQQTSEGQLVGSSIRIQYGQIAESKRVSYVVITLRPLQSNRDEKRNLLVVSIERNEMEN